MRDIARNIIEKKMVEAKEEEAKIVETKKKVKVDVVPDVDFDEVQTEDMFEIEVKPKNEKKSKLDIELYMTTGRSYYNVKVNDRINHPIQYHPSPSNCKFATIEYAQGFIDRFGAEGINEIIKLGYKAVVLLTLTNRRYADIIKNGCDVLYCMEVPIGYSEEPQFHILIQKPESIYEDRIKKYGIKGYLRAATK